MDQFDATQIDIELCYPFKFRSAFVWSCSQCGSFDPAYVRTVLK